MRFSGRGETRGRKANASFWHGALTSRTVKETALWNHLRNSVVLFLGISIPSKAAQWREFAQLWARIDILTASSGARVTLDSSLELSESNFLHV